MSQRLERRDFLKAALSCIALLPPVASIGCSDGSSSSSSSPAPAPKTYASRASRVTDSFFEDAALAAAALIGQRYLALIAPNAPNAPNATDDAIDAIVAPTVQLLESDDRDDVVLQALRARVLSDFADSSTTVIDGWTFATTELHLCVLARSVLT